MRVGTGNAGGTACRIGTRRTARNCHPRLCGLISGYNSGDKPSDDYGVFVMKRLRMQGFLVLDYTKTKEAVHAISGWIREGKLKTEETVAEGLENAPVVLNRLFDGSHRGKLVLRVDPQA